MFADVGAVGASCGKLDLGDMIGKRVQQACQNRTLCVEASQKMSVTPH